MFKDSPYSREMTPQEKEEQRSLRIKVHYCELIQYEIQKLTEDQLYKMFVLIKNTIEENNMVNSRKKGSPKNRVLFPADSTNNSVALPEDMLDRVDKVKKIVASNGLTGGYGIISQTVNDIAPDGYDDDVAVCICFCVPEVLDGMVTVRNQYKSGHIYEITTREVGEKDEKKNVVQLYTLVQVEQAIKNIATKIQK